MATELTDLDLGEWSICIDPANEDSTIEIVKSKSGHVPVLKETDMSDENLDLHDDEAGDDEFEAFAADVVDEFNELSEDEQIEALVGLAAENAELGIAVEDATEVVKSLTENTVSKTRYEEVVQLAKSAGDLIEKMKKTGNAAADDGGLVDEIRKANGGHNLSPEAEARIVELEKSNQAIARKENIAKARAYGFGNPETVADLETGIRKSLGAESADKFVALVKQAAGIAKASPLFQVQGEDAGADANDPIAKCKASVEQIRKANPGMTAAAAEAQYWEANPDEYGAYQASFRANARGHAA